MDSLPEETTLAGELLDAAQRDIHVYLSATEDPNREAAGQAALRGLNAAIRVLGNARHRLLIEVNGIDETATRLVDRGIRNPGNSGPGF
jgi:hypothetical protein